TNRVRGRAFSNTSTHQRPWAPRSTARVRPDQYHSFYSAAATLFTTMKNQIHLGFRSEARRGNRRSTIWRRSGAWPGLLLAGCCAMLAGLTWPARAAVTEAWVHRYNGPANRTDEARAVAMDASGNVVVAGYSSGSGDDSDYYTAKYAAADGALLWEKRY